MPKLSFVKAEKKHEKAGHEKAGHEKAEHEKAEHKEIRHENLGSFSSFSFQRRRHQNKFFLQSGNRKQARTLFTKVLRKGRGEERGFKLRMTS